MTSARIGPPVSIGVDYGTESGRVVVLDLSQGDLLGRAVVPFRHGVIETALPDGGAPLGPDWALHHPEDYVTVLVEGIPAALRAAAVDPARVIGLGIDATCCTVLPTDARGTPLCLLPPWRNRPHAWPKLWKHHAAQPIADRMTAAARDRREPFLRRYGGRISSEWYFPKLIQVGEEDPLVYQATDVFVEVTDWVVWQLTGTLRRNSCAAGYKALWSDTEGLPPEAYFATVAPSVPHLKNRLGADFYPLGTRAGVLTARMADRVGLPASVAVAVGNVDAMVSVPGAGVREPERLVMVLGTSICHLNLTQDAVEPPGITGVVRDGVLPGWYGFETGQAAVGDMFAWFERSASPAPVVDRAAHAGRSVLQQLEVEAGETAPGASGLVALDWWNGNRSILNDADLSGVLIGLTLSTTPGEIYRGLLESVAFGTRRILDNLAAHGIPIRDLVATGGLPGKSPLLMQLYADITGLAVVVPDAEEIPARGAALFGAVAAGPEAGGFPSIDAAAKALAPSVRTRYAPSAEAHATYDRVYAVYRDLYDWMGRADSVLHRLKAIRRSLRPDQPPAAT